MTRAVLIVFVAGSALLALAMVAGVHAGDPERALARREAAWHAQVEPGDVVLQDLPCGLRCQLLQDVTHTRYTQVGLVLDENGQRMVWEVFASVGPVPLAQWVQRGRDGAVAVYRPEPALRPKLPAVAEAMRGLRGRSFDSAFQWDDDRFYASELVDKVFQRGAGVLLAEPHVIGPGGLGSHKDGAQIISDGKLTEETAWVTPADLVRSPHLQKVVDELPGPPDGEGQGK